MQVDELAHRLDVVVGVLQGPHAVAGHAGADHLVVVEAHAGVADRAGLGLADVVQQRGEAHDALGPGLGHDRDGVGQHVLVAVDRVLLEAHGRQLGQELVDQPGVDQEPQARRRVLDHEQLVELVADPLGRHDLEPVAQLARPRRPAPASGSRPYPAMNRAARSMRSGSSVNDSSGASGVRSTLAARSAAPPNGSISSGSGSASAMALTVKSRRDRSASMASAKTTSGLRESGVVGLGPVRGDLEVAAVLLAADRAEPLALGPHRVGPARHEPLGLARAGRRW